MNNCSANEQLARGKAHRGTSATGKPHRITLFGIGRDRLESPNVGSSPGHPNRSATAAMVRKIGRSKGVP
jgi:hypothetical protein